MNPLEQLRDIHLPEPVFWWPPAAGWWLLALIIIAIAFLIPKAIKRFKNKPLKKIALLEFNKIQQAFNNHQNTAQLAQEISVLLRRICISYNPRYESASLTGKDWLNYLNKMAGDNIFSDQMGEIIFTAPYQKQAQFNGDDLIHSCKNWIDHLPRRTIK
ncbi:MAG: DUF4381 domain-containing protein [Gammaproteobacteria bacterium]|nr:DUF4381 domain-containing protein [Gammaproteobacteria bacterium]